MGTGFDEGFELITGAHRPPHAYVHVPFCVSKCSYCDFASVAGAPDSIVDAVFTGLRSEIRRCAEWALPGLVETLYVGGGTPSHVGSQTADLVRFALGEFPFHEPVEVTVEANPESFTPRVAAELAEAGVTRLSIGVQSFDEHVLRVLGRPHGPAQAEMACALAVREGMALSVDLMCGVPGQSISSWQETLDRAARTGAGHMSIYPLSIEEGTPLAVAIDAELLDAPDPDLTADMMLLGEAVLERAGLRRYEVANYARPGAESRHNTAYWTGHEYLGIGPSAHGMLDAATAQALGLVTGEGPTGDAVETVGRVRFAEEAGIDGWLTGSRDRSVEVLSPHEARREDVMLGLRLVRGVNAAEVERAGLVQVMESLAADGLVSLDRITGRWATTTRGWLLGNEVFGRVWMGE